MKIVVIGLGYVGLSNALILAQQNEVIGVDISEGRVNLLNNKKLPILDEQLSTFLETQDLNFSATTDLNKALQSADYVIVSTPTNYCSETGRFDTSIVEENIRQIIQSNPLALIIIKSTIPIGFVQLMRSKFQTKNIIFSPEFLREGHALEDNLYPSRIIIGEISARAEAFGLLLKKAARKNDIKIICMGANEAETVKLFANAYLAMRVAFFNELDSFAISKNLDTKQIIEGISLDTRIGESYNNPSFGYGGYCLPKDTKQVVANFGDIPQDLMSAIVNSNVTRKKFLVEQILLENSNVVGVYRLAMKLSSDNHRESAVLDIIHMLSQKNVKIIIFEPGLTSSTYCGYYIEPDLTKFKLNSDIILSNRMYSDLIDVSEKVFTRDVYGVN
ncbi:nucleotide sugar dehydrogenase [Planktomarina temperata]|nr:nucleotide sugar dehydrogenase [Planktomarina temperata]